MVPVLYGDVVLDANEDLKMAVISGDQLVSYLSLKLKPERIILGSDVDGIFDRDLKNTPGTTTGKGAIIRGSTIPGRGPDS